LNCHLFLQGDIRIGKSTLIRKAILSYLNDVGGYYVQRIYANDNPKRYIGFAVKPVSMKDDYQLNAYVNSLSDVNGLFLYCNQLGIWQQIPGVFTRAAVDYMNNAILQKKKLIIMDELGGVELEDIAFSKTVLSILNGDIPVLGVLKLPLNVQKFKKAAGGKYDIAIEKIQRIYDEIKNHKKVTVLTLSKTEDFSVETKLLGFVKGVFDREKI